MKSLKDIDKKIKLIENFKAYLANENKGHTSVLSTLKSSQTEGPLTYLLRWSKTSHALIFLLSNKVVQVYFKDHTELQVDTVARRVTYLSENGEVTSLTVKEANTT